MQPAPQNTIAQSASARVAALAATILLLVLVLRPVPPAAAQPGAAQVPPLQVGETYKVLVGTAAMRFKILETGRGGLVKVEAADEGSRVGIPGGTTWWLNLNTALLVEAAR